MIICKCVRCGHEWATRKATRPTRCGRCSAKYWYRPARVPRIKPVPHSVGRPAKYPVHVLNVGEIMILPIINDNVPSMRQSISAYGRRKGKRYETLIVVAGLRVKRTL